jgi:hypothetical protein
LSRSACHPLAHAPPIAFEWDRDVSTVVRREPRIIVTLRPAAIPAWNEMQIREHDMRDDPHADLLNYIDVNREERIALR